MFSSRTPHVEPEQPAADTSVHEVVLETPPVDNTPAVDPASIPLPADEAEEFNPVPPVFLTDETPAPTPVPAPEATEPPPEINGTPAGIDDALVVIASGMHSLTRVVTRC